MAFRLFLSNLIKLKVGLNTDDITNLWLFSNKDVDHIHSKLNTKSFVVYPGVPWCLNPLTVKTVMALKAFDFEDSKKNGKSKTVTNHIFSLKKCQPFEKFLLPGKYFDLISHKVANLNLIWKYHGNELRLTSYVYWSIVWPVWSSWIGVHLNCRRPDFPNQQKQKLCLPTKLNLL